MNRSFFTNGPDKLGDSATTGIFIEPDLDDARTHPPVRCLAD